MTIEETKEAIRIMQGYVDNKPIEVKLQRATVWEGFTDGEEPNWDFLNCDYRIKPEPHYRPFKDTDEVVEAIKEHGNLLKTKSNIFYTLNSFHYLGCNGYFFTSTHGNVSQEQMLTDYVFADGIPFGKLEK